MEGLTEKQKDFLALGKRMKEIIALADSLTYQGHPIVNEWIKELEKIVLKYHTSYMLTSIWRYGYLPHKEILFDVITYLRRELKQEGIFSQEFNKVIVLDRFQQRKKDFFEIREQFKEVEKYIDVVGVDNRFLELDFWMDDLLMVATEYYERDVIEKVKEYKDFHLREKVIDACNSLRLVFEREGWDSGILKKYGDLLECEKEF